ncbi:B-box zinc finger protein [Methanoplanus limicola]|nr:B-box zinc finger protein [Methanoplanus limicola]
MRKRKTPGRTSIAVDNDTKEVIDWSMGKSDSKSVNGYVRKLLEKKHDLKWDELLTIARNEQLVCEEHNLPYIMICEDCNKALCPDCDIKAHLDLGHDVKNFCRKHQIGYNGHCLLCEKERIEEVIKIPDISPDKLMEILDSNEEIIVIDVRTEKEWGEGHLPLKYNKNINFVFNIPYFYIDLTKKDKFRELSKITLNNSLKKFIMVSQGPLVKGEEPEGSTRSYIFGALLKSMFNINNIVCLDGGWAGFHKKYPDIVEEHNKGGECRVCKFYGR